MSTKQDLITKATATSNRQHQTEKLKQFHFQYKTIRVTNLLVFDCCCWFCFFHLNALCCHLPSHNLEYGWRKRDEGKRYKQTTLNFSFCFALISLLGSVHFARPERSIAFFSCFFTHVLYINISSVRELSHKKMNVCPFFSLFCHIYFSSFHSFFYKLAFVFVCEMSNF